MRSDPEVLETAVALLQIDDAGKKAAIVAELEQLANNLAQDNDRATNLKVLTAELDNIEETAERLVTMVGDYDKHLVDIFSITLGAEATYLSRKGGLGSWSPASGAPIGTKVIVDPCPADWAIEYEHRTQLRALAKRARTIRLAMVGKYGTDKGGYPLRKQFFGAPKSTFVWQLVRVWAERFGPDDLSANPKRPMFVFVELLSEWATGKKHKGLADDIKYAARTVPDWWSKRDKLHVLKFGEAP